MITTITKKYFTQKIEEEKTIQCARIHPVFVTIPSVVNPDSIRDLQVPDTQYLSQYMGF